MAVSGTLKSPNYPKHYPNGQYCSWKIIVNTTQQIHLVFKSFNLQNERHTDELYVYDGKMKQERCWECFTEVTLPQRKESTLHQTGCFQYSNQTRMIHTPASALLIFLVTKRVSLITFRNFVRNVMN